MELRQIRYFIAVAEEGNFGAAARRLNISQPPITRQVRKLEDELGVTLLRRTPKGAELTPAGAAFLDDARQTLAQISRAVERSRAAQRGELGVLEVGYFGSPIYRAVPSILKAFRTSLPNVEVALTRMTKNEQVEALKSGQLHIGFGRYYASEPGLVVEPIISERLVLAVPDTVDSETLDQDPLKYLLDHSVILFPQKGRPNFADEILGLLKGLGVDPHVSAITEDVRSALTLTAIGSGLTLVPSSVADFRWSGVRFIPIDALGASCTVSCLYRRSDTSPLLRMIRTTVKEYKAELAGKAAAQASSALEAP